MNNLEAPFARRTMRRVDEATTEEHEFSVVTYNILADHWIQQKSGTKGRYSYCPNDYKMLRAQGKTSHRHTLFMTEVKCPYTKSGAEPGFFLGGGAPVRNGITDFFCAEY